MHILCCRQIKRRTRCICSGSNYVAKNVYLTIVDDKCSSIRNFDDLSECFHNDLRCPRQMTYIRTWNCLQVCLVDSPQWCVMPWPFVHSDSTCFHVVLFPTVRGAFNYSVICVQWVLPLNFTVARHADRAMIAC